MKSHSPFTTWWLNRTLRFGEPFGEPEKHDMMGKYPVVDDLTPSQDTEPSPIIVSPSEPGTERDIQSASDSLAPGPSVTTKVASGHGGKQVGRVPRLMYEL